MDRAAGLGSKPGLSLAKKKRLSLRDHGGLKQPGNAESPCKDVEVSTAAKKDLSSYFVPRGTQKVVQSLKATEVNVVQSDDEECTILDESYMGRGLPREDTQRTTDGLDELQSARCIWTGREKTDNNFDRGLLVEQVLNKYDKSQQNPSQEDNKAVNCLNEKFVLGDCERSSEPQNGGHVAAECFLEEDLDEEYDDARLEVKDSKQGYRRYDVPDSVSGAMDIKNQDRFGSSSAFRDDLFFGEENYDSENEIPSGPQQEPESQAEVTAEGHSSLTDISFKESFYRGGTDWSALYDVDEYGLPCSESPLFGSLPSCSTKDTGESMHSEIIEECKVVKVKPITPFSSPQILSSRSSLYNKEETVNAAKRFSKLKQVDLSSFLGLKRKLPPQEIVPAQNQRQQDIGTYFGLSPLVTKPSSGASFLSKFQQVDTFPAPPSGKNGLRKGGGGWNRKDEPPRKCPFYKKMPGTPFTVDAFKFGSIEGCKAYFLSHFHSDHYGGLTRSWSHGPIFCTPVTGRLVSMCLGVDSQWLHPVKLGVKFVVESIEVQFLEANHCPGAALILFETPGGQRILHTGDFRACKGMQAYPELLRAHVNSLYLDTTYCNPKYNFPLQEDVIKFVVKVTRAALARNPKTLVAVGTYSIGKERVYLGIAKALDLNIFADKRRARILCSLEWPDLTERLCGDASSSMLHVLPISHLNPTKLRAYMQSLHPRYSAVLGFRPTGWTYSEKVGSNLEQMKPQCSGPVTLYGVPYSEHSSFSELQEFVQFLQPQTIIATVNIGTAAQRERMQFHFKQWLRS